MRFEGLNPSLAEHLLFTRKAQGARLYISESSDFYVIDVYTLFVKKENSKTWWNIKAEFDIFALKTQVGSTGGLQRHNERELRSTTFKQKYQA